MCHNMLWVPPEADHSFYTFINKNVHNFLALVTNFCYNKVEWLVVFFPCSHKVFSRFPGWILTRPAFQKFQHRRLRFYDKFRR